MGYIDAELDLAPIDKVDARNEFRRFTVLPATEAAFQNFASYSASVGSSPFPGVLLVVLYVLFFENMYNTQVRRP